MATKGGSKSQKRFATEKVRKQEVKGGKWTIRSIPGPFTRKKSIPLGTLLRDQLGACRNLKEARAVLLGGKVHVNGKKCKDYRMPVGFFDIVSIEGTDKDYRIVYDLKGRLVPREEEKKEKKTKLCRVEGKRAAKKGKILVATNDGRSILVEKAGFGIGDSLEIEVPSQEVKNVIKLEKGANVFITGGKHAGEESVVREVKRGSLESKKLVLLKSGKKEFQTTVENVFAVGGKK